MPVTSSAFKLTFALCLLFTIPILLIQTQPYDDMELRAFLTPTDDCPAPCFMGIQPGITTVDEAIAILQAHEWVAEVSITGYSRLGLHRIEWRWKPNLSPMLEPERIPRSGGRLIADEGVVQYMELLTRIRAGDAWLILGKAQNYTSLLQLGGPIGGPKPPKPITAIYSNIVFIAWTDCPYQRNFWNARIELVIAKSNEWLNQVSAYPTISGMIPVTRYVRDLTQANCPLNP
jgi:hypothetical protein